MKVLLLTVGGSDAPIIISIEHNKPDYVVFLCTEDDESGTKGSLNSIKGEGLVCQSKACGQCGYKADDRKNIVSRTQLKDGDYEIITVEADNPFDCYEKASLAIRRFLKKGDKVVVDYTGGTKSMSVGLAVAGMEYTECEFILVLGKRIDTVKIRDGMERVSNLPINVVYINRQLSLCGSLVARWDYQAAIPVLEDIISSKYVLDAAAYERSLYLCRAFASWDKFDYQAAVPLIELYKNEEPVAPYNAVLKRIRATINWYGNSSQESGRIPGYDLVYDVLLNAERRSEQGKYDDAISRTYRALEMYAQFCLRSNNPSLSSDDIDIASLPSDIQGIYEEKRNSKGKVQLALAESYELLEKMGHPSGQVWSKEKAKILNVLNKRNFSFLAHGIKPIVKSDFDAIFQAVCSFIEACDDAIGNKRGFKDALQLPRKIETSKAKG